MEVPRCLLEGSVRAGMTVDAEHEHPINFATMETQRKSASDPSSAIRTAPEHDLEI